jgi:predicted PurR-regulated permease PerM
MTGGARNSAARRPVGLGLAAAAKKQAHVQHLDQCTPGPPARIADPDGAVGYRRPMSGSNPPPATTDRSDTAARRTARVVAAAIADPRLIRRVSVAVIAVVLFIQVFEWFFFGVRHLLFLLLLAWLFAIAMEPAVSWMARRGIRRGGGTGIVMVGLFLAIVAFSAVFGAIFIEQVVSLVQALPDTLTTLVDWVNRTFNTNFDPSQLTDLLQITPERVAEWASTIGLGLFGFFTSLVGVVFDLFTVLLFAFYFSAQGPQLRRTVASWMPAQSQRVVGQVWQIAIEKTGGYVVSRLVLAVLAAVCTSTFLLILDVPFWLPLGIWTGVVSQFIPTLGTYLGWRTSCPDRVQQQHAGRRPRRHLRDRLPAGGELRLLATHQQPNHGHPSGRRLRRRHHRWGARRGARCDHRDPHRRQHPGHHRNLRSALRNHPGDGA